MKKFIATYVQTSYTSDGRPRVLGVYNTKNEALFEVNYDMEMWYKNTHNNGAALDHEIDYGKMTVWYNNTHYGEDLDHKIDYGKMTAKVGDTECIWNIEEIEI